MQSLEERLRSYAEQLADAVPAVTVPRLESAEVSGANASHDPTRGLRWTPTLRRTPGILLAVAVTVALVIVVVAGGVFSTSTKQAPRPGAGGSSLESISIPAGYESPVGLAVSPVDNSVWFWATSSTKLSLFNWVPGSGTRRTIALGSPTSLDCTSAHGGLAVDASDTVWIACSRELISYEVPSGQITKLSIPTVVSAVPGASAAADEFVMGVAESGDRLAIALRDGGQVLILNTTSRRFSTVKLPPLTSPVGIAYSATHTLALTLIAVDSPESNSGLFEITATGRTRFVHVTEPMAVAPTGDSFVVEPGLLLITGDRVSKLRSASSLAAKGVHVSVGPLAAGGGTVFVGTESGLAELKARSVATVALPRTSDCPHLSGPPPARSAQSTSRPKPVQCPQTALNLVATSTGGVYFTAWSAGAKLEYLPPSFDSHQAAFRFVPTVTSTMTFAACNLVISPAPTAGSAADATRAFSAYPGPDLASIHRLTRAETPQASA